MMYFNNNKKRPKFSEAIWKLLYANFNVMCYQYFLLYLSVHSQFIYSISHIEICPNPASRRSLLFSFYSVLSTLSLLSPVLCGSVLTFSLNPGESHQRLLGAHLLAIFRGGLAIGKFETFPGGPLHFPLCGPAPFPLFISSEHSWSYLMGMFAGRTWLASKIRPGVTVL